MTVFSGQTSQATPDLPTIRRWESPLRIALTHPPKLSRLSNRTPTALRFRTLIASPLVTSASELNRKAQEALEFDDLDGSCNINLIADLRNKRVAW